jgi:hypothetical protein
LRKFNLSDQWQYVKSFCRGQPESSSVKPEYAVNKTDTEFGQGKTKNFKNTRKTPEMSRAPHVPKLSDAIKIPIQTVCYQGWSKQINGHVIELDHLSDGIALTTDGYRHPIRWKVYEQRIKCLHLRNGGGCPEDRRYIYYVYGQDGKRYRALYLRGDNIGTRVDHGLRYNRDCMSRRQRAAYSIRFERRKAIRRRRRERQHDQQIANYRARITASLTFGQLSEGAGGIIGQLSDDISH